LKRVAAWAAQVENKLVFVFSTRDPLSAFMSAVPPMESWRTSQMPQDEVRFKRERGELDSKLAALRRISASTAPRTRVFLVHGRDDAAREGLTDLLTAFEVETLPWREAAHAAGMGSATTLEIVKAGMAYADVVVVLLTPDDMARLRPELAPGEQEEEFKGQPRMNVVFEAGLAMGLAPNPERDRERIVFVQVGRVREFSDIYGINIIRLNDSPERRKDLAERLRTAGLAVRLDSGPDAKWLSAGRFG
jgi:predicted nucleotide-binding protein